MLNASASTELGELVVEVIPILGFTQPLESLAEACRDQVPMAVVIADEAPSFRSAGGYAG
jgi:hypothetical protein